jgi:hypothetical protein
MLGFTGSPDCLLKRGKFSIRRKESFADLCRIRHFNPDDLRMHRCDEGVEFRVLCLSHLLDLFFDPDNCLILGAAMTTSTRDFDAACGKTAPLMSLGYDGVVHDCTKKL